MQAAKPVRFGAFEADLSTGELRKHGTLVRLQEQPAKLLGALLDHPGEVVIREDLIKLLWPDGTFVDYDRGLNAAVNRLRQALSDSAESPRYVETVARRGYRFIEPVERDGTTAEHPLQAGSAQKETHAPHRWLWITGVGGVIAVVVGTWLGQSNREAPAPSLPPIPLTSYEGIETQPWFSPDGTQIAFSWNGEKQDQFDIYVKSLGSGLPQRLTTDPALDAYPTWSPDGRYLAFHRVGAGIFLVPPSGGPERQLLPPQVRVRPMSWTPDGKQLAFGRNRTETEPAGIFVIDVLGGPAERITSAEPPGYHVAPSFSPDGRSMAFASCHGDHSCSLAVVLLDDRLTSRAPARIIANRTAFIQKITWTADDTVVFSEASNLGYRLWKAGVRTSSDIQPVNFAGPGSSNPAYSVNGRRLAYSRAHTNREIWNFGKGVLTRNSMSSTYEDHDPQFSPDGSRVAFVSNRSGGSEIWVASADGSTAVQVTTSMASGSPRWSHDGRRIAYDTRADDGHWDINVIDASGGPPKRIVIHPADDYAPSFSRDGKWILFTSNRTGANEIYRVPATGGGEPVQLTSRGGTVAFESADGKSLYYSKLNGTCGDPLFERSLAGGPERRVIDSLCSRTFSVTEKGILYASGPSADRSLIIQRFDPATGRNRELGRTGPLHGPFAMTASGEYILLSAGERAGADLMLVENFQ